MMDCSLKIILKAGLIICLENKIYGFNKFAA